MDFSGLSAAQHSTAQHSTAQRSAAQHSTAQRSAVWLGAQQCCVARGAAVLCG